MKFVNFYARIQRIRISIRGLRHTSVVESVYETDKVPDSIISQSVVVIQIRHYLITFADNFSV